MYKNVISIKIRVIRDPKRDTTIFLTRKLLSKWDVKSNDTPLCNTEVATISYVTNAYASKAKPKEYHITQTTFLQRNTLFLLLQSLKLNEDIMSQMKRLVIAVSFTNFRVVSNISIEFAEKIIWDVGPFFMVNNAIIFQSNFTQPSYDFNFRDTDAYYQLEIRPIGPIGWSRIEDRLQVLMD